MDINALMQAAQQDPAAAQFIQQLLSGGQSMMQRMPEVQPAPPLAAPEIEPMAPLAPLPVFEPVRNAVDDFLGQWAPPEQPPQPDPAQGGAPPTAPTDQFFEQGGMAQPQPEGEDPGMMQDIIGQMLGRFGGLIGR